MRDRSKIVKAGSASRAHPVHEVPAEGTNVLFDVWLVSRAVTGALDTALAPTGLTADEFGVYSVLTTSEAMTPSDLARWMAAPPTTVSSYIKRLEGRGHVVRERNPGDGRSFVLRLTTSGRAAHLAGGKAFLPVLDRIVNALGSEEPAVRRSLESLRVAIDEQ